MKVDMHIHTSKSDGRDSLHNMVEAAEARGLDLIAITDHGPGHGSGINERQALETKKEAELLQPNYHVRILVGIEAEILPTGEVLLDSREGLDIVLASYHGASSVEAYYQAVLRAVTDPKVDVLAHHAWVIGGFEQAGEYDDVLIERMAAHGVAIEINSKHTLPSWDFLIKCRDAGVKYTIGSDAHKAADVGSVAWAKNTARHIYGDKGLFLP
ncbi:PHP domain-containing protein [Methanocella conradii]|uniref:PHP domain-containing protein n=1 Tax=Methanocella conradii TaxID=1175444 RepID=UPI00157D6D5A|nr:PHP domain-containing protein [Methanocella conradii]